MRIQCRALRQRLTTSLGIAISLVSQMIWWSTPAESQSFLQQLFGLGPPPQVRYVAPPPHRMAPRPGPGPVQYFVPLQKPRSSDGASRASTSSSSEGKGSYTTVCVRMCDGFYFPISHKVQRGRFYRDADECRSRCGMADARLFYHSSREDMKSAVDLTGRSYANLPIAFLHRKRLVSGCTCKPAPWSEASLSRHERYAIAEGHKPTGAGRPAVGGMTVVAGNYEKPVTVDSQPQEAASPKQSATASNEVAALPTPRVASSASAEADASANVNQPEASPPVVAQKRWNPNGKPAKKRIVQAQVRQMVPGSAPKPAVVAIPPFKPKGTAVASGKFTWPGDQATRMR